MNMQTSQGSRYSPVAMLLHWLIAIAVITNWQIFESTEHLPKAEAQAIMANHMALGMIILVLVVLRLVWRHVHKPPPFAGHLQGWEVVLARITHGLFYLLLIVMPILGWVAMSSFGQEISIFGWFHLPALPLAQNKQLGETIFEIHGTLGTILLGLIALHVLAVIKHTLLDRDGNLFRMLPFGRAKA